MPENGALSDESNALRECFDALGIQIGPAQVSRSMTDVALFGMGPDEEHLRQNLPGLQNETLADFLAKNTTPYPVEPDFTWDGQLLCLREEEFRELFRDGRGWDRFREVYPESSGILEFSRVGFNRDLTQALFYAGVTFDGLAGSGSYWLFAREHGRWIRLGSVMAWIS